MFAVQAPPQDRAVLQSRPEPTAERGSEEDPGGRVSTHSLRAVWTSWDWKDHYTYRSNTTGAVQPLKSVFGARSVLKEYISRIMVLAC